VTAIDEFEAARAGLEEVLIEVFGTVVGERAVAAPVDEPLPDGLVVSSRLMIHDEQDDSYAMVWIRTSSIMAWVLAGRMLLLTDPEPDDLLDAVGELGNMAAGKVKSLLHNVCRLSLATVESDPQGQRPVVPREITVRAAILGETVEMVIHPQCGPADAVWTLPIASRPALGVR
jgi:Chemotaxis phosphatase CheX